MRKLFAPAIDKQPKEPDAEMAAVRAKIAKRAGAMGTDDLFLWGDQAVFDVGKALDDYRKDREEVQALDARRCAAILHAVIDELTKRAK